MVVLVVQPEDHRRVAGHFHQYIVEGPQAVAAEGVGLVEHTLGVVQLAGGGGEEPVPEQGDLLLQGPLGVNHLVHPIGLGALEVHHAVLVGLIPPDQVVVPFGGVFGVEQLLEGGLVSLGLVFFQLLEGGAESGPPQQVGHESKSIVSHHAASQKRPRTE